MRRARLYPIEEAAARLLPGYGRILAAVSGGPDSVALLRACVAVAPGRVVAAHCNFSLRGAESDRDEEFVAALCARLGVELRAVRFDTRTYMEATPGLSLEMACRQLRYDWFASLMQSEAIGCLALGHNADDNVETLLLNLLRGSGSKGLSGMAGNRNGVVRPLLAFSRKEILNYLTMIGQDYIVDSSNLTSDYRRNFLRNELIPLLETRWPGARKALARSRAALEADSRIVEAAVADVAAESCRWLPFRRLEDSADPATLLLYFIRKVGGSPEMAAEMAASWSAASEPGKTWVLAGAEVEKEREGFRIVDPDPGLDPADYRWSRFDGPWEELIAYLKERSNKAVALPEGPENYTLRRARKGDRLEPLGAKGSRLLSDAMRDARWPLWKRKRLAVIEREGKLIWAEGLARSRRDAVAPGQPEIWIMERREE